MNSSFRIDDKRSFRLIRPPGLPKGATPYTDLEAKPVPRVVWLKVTEALIPGRHDPNLWLALDPRQWKVHHK
jgi:hypothetical protein